MKRDDGTPRRQRTAASLSQSIQQIMNGSRQSFLRSDGYRAHLQFVVTAIAALAWSRPALYAILLATGLNLTPWIRLPLGAPLLQLDPWGGPADRSYAATPPLIASADLGW